MEYRKLPHGEEMISVIGLGTSVIGESSVDNVVETVTYALDHGIKEKREEPTKSLHWRDGR